MQDERVGQGRDEELRAPSWLDRACIVVPAYDAETTLGAVVADLRERIPELGDAIFVVDDGSHDATDRIARDLGCVVLGSSPGEPTERKNVGKGATLRVGFEAAVARGKTVALTVDADGQHPAAEARRVLLSVPSEATLVLGIRDLMRAGAPRANRFSNGISNYFLSRFARRELLDTQCGLRRYPIRETLALDARASGYDFEAEVLLHAVWSGLDIVEEPVRVVYPEDRQTHFRVSRDPWLILRTVLGTVGSHWLSPSTEARPRSSSRSRTSPHEDDGEAG
jgi:glycosyltransferase involved in cell wall biosynthesis